MSPARLLARNYRGNLLRSTLRSCVRGTLIAAYFVVAAGIPLPMIREPAKSRELFPCASSGCGCDSAEKCWRSCCCHTLAERLAWAAKNGVKPPEFALAAARDAGLDAGGRPLVARVVVAKVVNAHLATKTCCRSKRSCCSSHSKSCCSSHNHPKQQNDKTDFIIAWRALACHGQSLQWLAAVPSLITVELELSDHLAPVAWLGPHSSEFASPLSDTPTPPPPERA
jgi:hypothetical protein